MSYFAQQEPDIYDDGDYRRNVPRRKKTNSLLVLRPLGKVKPTTYHLPSDGWVYGKEDEPDEEGAAVVVGSWKNHTANPEGLPGRDFVRLNKQAALHGCVTSKNVSSFRRANDIRLRQGPIAQREMARSKNSFDRYTTFGRPSEPSTSIADLLNNTYQRQWIGEQRSMKRADISKGRHMKYAQSQHTRASLGHTKVRAPPPKKMFKLKQYRNVPSRVRLPQGYGIYPGHGNQKLPAAQRVSQTTGGVGYNLQPMQNAPQPGQLANRPMNGQNQPGVPVQTQPTIPAMEIDSDRDQQYQEGYLEGLAQGEAYQASQAQNQQDMYNDTQEMYLQQGIPVGEQQ